MSNVGEMVASDVSGRSTARALLGLLALAFLATGGCGKSSVRTDRDVKPSESPLTAEALAHVDVVAAWSRGVWYGKPHLAENYFDVALRNRSDEPRWFVLPETFPFDDKEPTASPGGEGEVQWFQLSKAPTNVVIAMGVYTGMWALLLAGHATVGLRDLKISSHWSDRPKTVRLTLLIVKSITVGGKPLANSVSVDPLSQGGLTDAPRSAADPRALPFWHPADRTKSEPVVLDIESRQTLEIALSDGPR